MTAPLIRRANEKDIPFIVHAIIESEKSNSQLVPSARLFGMDEDEYSEILRKLLETPTSNNEYSLSAYFIAEIDGQAMSSCCAWPEGDGESRIIISEVKTELIRNTLSTAQIMNLRKNMKMARDMQFKREPGTLQIEFAYTDSRARGKRLFPMVLDALIQDAKKKHPELSEVFAEIFGNNISSIKACESLGFKKKSSTKSDHPDILKFYCCNEKILMSKNI